MTQDTVSNTKLADDCSYLHAVGSICALLGWPPTDLAESGAIWDTKGSGDTNLPNYVVRLSSRLHISIERDGPCSYAEFARMRSVIGYAHSAGMVIDNDD
jgi:hypothetical protein